MNLNDILFRAVVRLSIYSTGNTRMTFYDAILTSKQLVVGHCSAAVEPA